MEFQEKLINSIKRRYIHHSNVHDIYDDLKEKLYKLYEELEEFSFYGLEVEFEENDTSVKLSINGFYLLFEFINDDDPPFIQVIWGKENQEYSFDKIDAQRWSHPTEVARGFDLYLHRAFNDLLNELR